MNLDFGNAVQQSARTLKQEGRDANQIAKVLCDRDPDGHNYGIGIILGGDGRPMPTSPTVLEGLKEELANSSAGSYMSSAKSMEDLRRSVLAWQRIPEKFWDRFILAVPSDAGTGAVVTALQFTLALESASFSILGVEELGWPPYKAMARLARIDFQEHPADDVIDGADVLPIYQAGPMNTTGRVSRAGLMSDRARSAAKRGCPVILDRAYSGFELARHAADMEYGELMARSTARFITPFIEHGVPFCMALSPTKAFVTFALRPCGFTLVHHPSPETVTAWKPLLNAAIRARGSAFEHPATRAFIRAMIEKRPQMEKEHGTALARLAEAESMWRRLAEGSAIEPLFGEDYAGLFRNPNIRQGAEAAIYNDHLYPVFAQNRCRLNVTGIPGDEQLAAKQVRVYTQYCH